MKPSEKIKQDIETLLDELKEAGYLVSFATMKGSKLMMCDKSLDNETIFVFSASIDVNNGYTNTISRYTTLAQLDEITENLLKLK